MSSIIKVDTIQDQDGNNIINENANTITIGKSGDTVTVALGATFVGGGIEWQSTIVTTSTLTAVAGKGYWIDTTSNACTVTLPASASVGDQIIFVDYARNWGTNAITINQNGLNYQGGTDNPVYDTNGQTVNIVYSGATNGWIPISDDDVADEGTYHTLFNRFFSSSWRRCRCWTLFSRWWWRCWRIQNIYSISYYQEQQLQ
jgi:hypothetical protein